MKRTLIAISFLLILVSPLILPLSMLTYQHQKIRHEVKEMIISGLNEDELTILVFQVDVARNELKWDHSSEFEYKGEKYDVVKSSVSNDSITYYCWWDHEEKAIEQQMEHSLQHALTNDLKTQNGKWTLINYLKVDYHSSDLICLEAPFFLQQEVLPTIYHRSHSNIFVSTPTPPPDLLLI